MTELLGKRDPHESQLHGPLEVKGAKPNMERELSNNVQRPLPGKPSACLEPKLVMTAFGTSVAMC